MFTVITVCYNSEATIRRTLDSMLAQTITDYEYWIIDGASTDATTEIIKEYEPRFEGRMHWVSEKDTGIYNAMNKGIRLSHGEMIGILNSDDWYEPDTLEQVKNAMVGGCEVCYGMCRVMQDGRMQEILMRTEQQIAKGNTMLHPACFISRKAYETIGLYNEKYPIAADMDWLLTAAESSNIVFTPVLHILSNFSKDGASACKQAEIEALQILKAHGYMHGVRYCYKIIATHLRWLMR